MKIAHISDLHLNTFYRDSHLKEIRTVLRYCKEHDVDHLVITGDITDNASEVNLNIFRKSLAYFGFDSGEKVSVVIGNHDIYGGIQKAEEIFNFPERCRKTDYNKKVHSFNEIMNFSFENCVYLSSNNNYPYAKIIGKNSNAEYSTVTNPFASNGEVQQQQYDEIVKILNEFGNFAKHKIILIHHHFNKLNVAAKFSSAGLWHNIEKQTMKLRKKRKLISLFNDFGISMVLHGHLHNSHKYERHGQLFVNSGGAIKGLDSEKLKFHFITLDKNNISTQLKSINSNFFKDKTLIDMLSAKRLNAELQNN